MKEPTTPTTTAPPPLLSLSALDGWVDLNPWHPRVLPFVVYLVVLAGINLAMDVSLWSYPALYALQCVVVAYLLWRYRGRLPELTLRFHWLAVPTGLALCVAWIALGWMMIGLSPERYGAGDEPHYFEQMRAQSGALYHMSLGLRLLGMSLLVPLFEELFIRSACLRGLHSAKKTGLGLVQLAEDMPLLGDWVAETAVGRRAAQHPPMFTQQLSAWPVGKLTLFGVAASTFVFMIHHAQRDWPGTIACGLVWCGLVWWTNRPSLPADRRPGLGPIAWSHGITNACLWAYCVSTGDWQFM